MTATAPTAGAAAEELLRSSGPALSAGAREESTTFWGRVADMFKGLWESFKRLLHIG